MGRGTTLVALMAVTVGNSACQRQSGPESTAPSGGGETVRKVVSVSGEAVCSEPVKVATIDDILWHTPDEWRAEAPFGREPVPVSRPMVAEFNLRIRPESVPLSSDCTSVCTRDRSGSRCDGDEGLDCFHRVKLRRWRQSFRDDGTVRIVSGERFRVRTTRIPFHIEEPYVTNVLEIAPTCADSCLSGETLCARDRLCYPSGKEYCVGCELRRPAECACQGAGGPLATGSSCSWWKSTDQLEEGICVQGRCVDGDPATRIDIELRDTADGIVAEIRAGMIGSEGPVEESDWPHLIDFVRKEAPLVREATVKAPRGIPNELVVSLMDALKDANIQVISIDRR